MTAFQILCFCSAVKRHRPGVNPAQSVDWACSPVYRAKIEGRNTERGEGGVGGGEGWGGGVGGGGWVWAIDVVVPNQTTESHKRFVWRRLRDTSRYFPPLS